MKAKFVKHNDPRQALGVSPLQRRNFRDKEDFLEWLVNFYIPDFYGVRDNDWYFLNKIIGSMMLDNGVFCNLPARLYDSILKIIKEAEKESGKMLSVSCNDLKEVSDILYKKSLE